MMTGHLGDELVARLMTAYPERIIRGENIYFEGDDGRIIELYDGVKDGTVPGRQACVPYQVAWELTRLDREFVNAFYQQYIFKHFPKSMIGGWWAEEPTLTYQQLTQKHIYDKSSHDREDLKRRKRAEIDRPFNDKIKVGMPTPMFDYSDQWEKSKTLIGFLGFSWPHWRVLFNRQTGDVRVLNLRPEDTVA